MKFIVRFLDKHFPFMTPTFLTIGLLAGAYAGQFVGIVPFLFAIATFLSSLKIDLGTFVETVKKPKGILVVLFILRIIMPLVALIVGIIIFPNDVYTQTGLLLFALLPVAINSIIWTVISKGNIALSLSVLFIDTLMIPLILPLSVLFFTGESIEFDTWGLMRSLLFMVVIPSLLGMFVNQATKGEFTKKWNPHLTPIAKIFMLIVIFINGGNIRRHFPPINGRLLLIMFSISLLCVAGYLISWYIASKFKFDDQDVKAIVFTGGMRNMSTGLVIAVAHFPPAAAIPIVSGIFFQQMICACIAKLIEIHYDKKEKINQKK